MAVNIVTFVARRKLGRGFAFYLRILTESILLIPFSAIYICLQVNSFLRKNIEECSHSVNLMEK